MKVYLDNGATTKVADEVVRTILPYFKKYYGNASSLHDFGVKAKEALENSRKIMAKELNAEPEEIIFTSGGSESDNLAIKGVVYANKKKGNHIITTKIEHPAVLAAFRELFLEGFKVTYLGVDKNGFINLNELKKAITKDTILVSVIHGNNEIGTLQDIEQIGKLCKEKRVYFHTDAVQSFTKEKIDVKKMNIDLLSASGHKIHGPKGIGFLYIRKGINVKKIISGGKHENNKRAGTENIPGIVGFAKAVQLDKKLNQIKKLRDYMIKKIEKEIQDSKLNGDRNKRLVNNVNISFRYVEGEGLLMHLNDKGVAVSTGSACSSQSLEPSHVLTAIGLKHEDAHGSIRFTLSKYNTKEEIDYTLKELKTIVSRLREMSPWKKGIKFDFKEVCHHEH